MCAKKASKKLKKIGKGAPEVEALDLGAELKYRLGSAFWRERRNQNLTQDEVAKAAGIKRQALGMIEAGKRTSNMVMLHRVALALKLPLWEIFKAAEEMDAGDLRPQLREKIRSDGKE